MTSLLNELSSLCSELRSEKVATRNKAAERLHSILTTSKNELIALLRTTRSCGDVQVSWTEVFHSAVEATLKHADKVEESQDSKSIQTMRNKNYIYNAIVTKLIDYNLEDENNFLSKATIFTAFTDGLSSRSAINNFSQLFLYLLDRGIYKSLTHVRELKVNEFSRILSYLFEMNVANDELLRFAALRSIIKTIELAVKYVQLSGDLIDYLPEVLVFSKIAKNDRHKSDVITVFYLFISQLAIDYHHTICDQIQELLPILCGFFDYRMKNETKKTLFHSIYVSLLTIYPHANNGDFSTSGITLRENWTKTLKKIKSMVDIEIKERRMTLCRPGLQVVNDTCLQRFVEMASLVTYLIYWHIETDENTVQENDSESRRKMSKPSDKLEQVLKCIQIHESKFNEIWLAILSEMISQHGAIINSSNFQQVLQTTLSVLLIFTNANNLRNVRLSLVSILHTEQMLISTKSLPMDYCIDLWTTIVDFLISDSSSTAEIIAEKHNLLQVLIAHSKLTIEQVSALMHTCMANTTMRCTECMSTVRQMLIYANECGIDKTCQLVNRIIPWAYETNDKIDIKRINIAPIDSSLIADTCAIAVINFLNNRKFPFTSEQKYQRSSDFQLKLLLYKQNRKFVCLEEHGKINKREETYTNETKNCLFQSNYELLMRELNFETTKNTTCNDILLDLAPLHKMACLMKTFLHYDVFSADNFTQCPLIKRIGLFLSHLEFQLKNNNPRNFDRTDIYEVLQCLDGVFTIFTSNEVLLTYLENQPLEELITFLGTSLKFSASQQLNSEIDDWSSVTFVCLKILSTLCASSSHYKDAFTHVFQYKFNVKTDLNIFLLLIKIYCSHKSVHAEIANWFVNILKTIFKLYHTNIDIIAQIVELIPAIFMYVQQFDDPLQNMLIALISLLKIAYKKSYSTRLTSNIVKSIRYIAENCNNICGMENFTNICLSVAKFLQLPLLEIQFASINTITALMDVNWLNGTATASEMHFDFCRQLYMHIDWKSLSIATTDLKENSNAVTIQILVSLFVFSAYHREIALQELTYFCALRKLTETDLKGFHQVSIYYNCTMPELTKPFITNLIHTWISKMYPILKFPYFLCCYTKDDFIQQNLKEIVTCLLLYAKPEDLKKLDKYVSKDQIIKLAAPMIHAFTLPHTAGCTEAQTSDYQQHISTLTANLKALGADIPIARGICNLNWETIYCSIKQLTNDERLQTLLGFPVFQQQTKWFNISYASLTCCLSLYINGTLEDVAGDSNLLTNLIIKSPIHLVHALGEFKKNCFACLFAFDKLKYFYMFCTLAELIIDSIPNNISSSATTKNCGQFFVRDIIFYILYNIQSEHQQEMQKASLVFLRHILNKPVITVGFCTEVLKTHLNDVCKALVASAENVAIPELAQLSMNILHHIIIDNRAQLCDAIALLDKFPATDQFTELRDSQFSVNLLESEIDFASSIESFLHTKNRGIEGLRATRQLISKNKLNLQQESKLLNKLIMRLVEIVRNCENLDFSLEAAKCLGEIGALKIDGISYYFQTDVSFYEKEATSQQPIEYFVQCMLEALEQLLLVFKATTHDEVCKVAQYLISSKHGEKMIDSFPLLNVFLVSNTKSGNYLDTYDSIVSINWMAALKSTETLEFDEWNRTFMSYIFKSCGWTDFQELASRDTYFAEASLQPFIKLLMDYKEQHLESLVAMLDYFFHEVFKAVYNSIESSNRKNVIFKEKRIINKMLNICECIRIRNQWKLPINLLYVVNACNYCQAYFMSILYLEMWALHEQNQSNDKSFNEIVSNDSFQESATEAYQSIGCKDAISGFLNPLHSRIHFLNLDNNWSDILLEASATEMSSDQLYTSILKRNGMLSLANLNQSNKSIDYEVCWRLCKWETAVEGHSKVNSLNDMEHEFEKHHFNALKCLYNREENNSLAAIANARQCILSIIKEISVECLHSVYKYLTWLHLLQQTEDFCQVQFNTATVVIDIFKKWQIEEDLKYGNFRCMEQVLSHQVALFNTAGVRANRKIKDFYKENPIEGCLLKCIKECKIAGEINLAKRNIAVLKNMQLSNEQMRVSVLLEDAEVCFKTGKFPITKAILLHVLKNKEFAYCLQRVRAYRMNGELLMESNTETFENVLRNFFNGSIDLLKQFAKSKEQIRQKHPNLIEIETFDEFERHNRKCAYETIAKYADREYTQINTFTNSDEFQMKCQIIQQNRQAAESVGKQNKDRDKNIGAVFMKKFAILDENEVQSIQQKCTDNLCIAVENYMKFCKLDETLSSPGIYRIIALWFANKQNNTLHAKIEEHISEVPTYKLICALNQMTARLNSKNQAFISLLKEMMVRCLQDHPHQTLYQLFPLVYAFNDGTVNKSNNRVNIAKEIISKAKNKSNSNCIKQLELLLPALIEFANMDVTDNKASSIALSDKLRRLKHLDAVQCPTIDLPVSTNLKYTITSIVKWEDKVSLVGGINAPKKLQCLCSNGAILPQLLKGKDDLRQDAVMQQVFSMINDLLRGEHETSERKLMLRTYKVVPLSMRSGILEWCQDTIPIGVYLSSDGKGGAHKKYRPNDFTITKCRQLAMQHLKSDLEKRYQVYAHICANIKPVFHYFLFEKFLVPGVWFERRLAYTNSVATTSIVGYILSIGDRHTQNILIDEKTAQVIHIDFGIAFEQGRIMPTPETVPFRLTRDMVSPMGVCGTNGVFTKSCEATMRILRRNQAVITTILEVLLYDPLYIWKVVPQISSTSDGNAYEEKNLTAQRALLCVQNKLEGKLAGIMGTADVDVQVQRLINDAISSRNLCQLYPGWDPYM